ncbi:tyrosine-type recombinase/integrase [Vibrio parahaemolyticus]|uniref:tyrosine-type recombinase/integrase n=1 Tax=Vibrio parahaemolyticus TaxID=670 RepID=UPI001BAFFE34|nr:site-specific integrase [Vibrio parahaemolyticus]QUD91396.1 tyrosine-type recombinase/integrase [Vibrio parahaemolyticus]HCG5932911.1 tyrosine-type recombinase/integrase [Vibrio parahaemolyticus]
MAKKNLLTAREIEKAKCPRNKAQGTMNDGAGLQLIVYKTGKKVWRMRLKGLNGKEVLLTFGSVDFISLKEARDLREKLVNARLQGKEPKHTLKKLRRKGILTVAELVLVFLEEKRNTWKESTYNGEFNRAKKYLIDSPFGPIPADALTVQHIYDFAQNMDKKGYKSQHKKVISLLKRGYELGSIKYELETIDVSKISQFLTRHKPESHACTDIEDLPAINTLIADSECSSQVKLLWDYLFLTSQRVQEATQNTWDNVNFDDMTIKIPAELAKNGLENIIPMSSQACRVLKLAKIISNGSPYIFPSPYMSLNKPISKNTLGNLLRSHGLKGTMSAHGIRSIFSSEMHEELDITESLIIEMILSHTDKDHIREIYNRSKFISKRRNVLERWGNIYEEITKNCSCTDVVENELVRLNLLPTGDS